MRFCHTFIPMFGGEYMPAAGSQRATKKQIRNLKKGGKIAKQVKKQADSYHATLDSPRAEAELDAALNSWTEEKTHSPTPTTKAPKQKAANWWQRFTDKIFQS